MTERIMQPLLFEIKPFNDRNRAVSFGVTKTSLNKGSYNVLEHIFYGMHNLEIPLEILSIENPAEILANYFAAGSLKRGNAHLNILNIPHDFFKLVNYINTNSYNNIGFASLAHKFKKSSCFDSSPGRQRKRFDILEQNVKDSRLEILEQNVKDSRLEILEQNVKDSRLEILEQNVGDRFVSSFFSPYRPSDKENSFIYDFHDPNRDGRNKGIYAKIIYEELKSLSDRAKQI